MTIATALTLVCDGCGVSSPPEPIAMYQSDRARGIRDLNARMRGFGWTQAVDGARPVDLCPLCASRARSRGDADAKAGDAA